MLYESRAKHRSTLSLLFPHQFGIVTTFPELKNTNIANIEMLNAASHAAAIKKLYRLQVSNLLL